MSTLKPDAELVAAARPRPNEPGAPRRAIALSLVSHTNVGKTTLARTLLGRDIGEVRDAPHVTESADRFTLLQTDVGQTLELWDTPGFGDSVRLLRRMRQAGNPLGWFLGAVWDRWRDKPFWHSQQALRNVREHADVVLYLVNAAEAPQAAGYVASEMALLAWLDKPILVLLNQLGAPRAPGEEAADVAAWRAHLAPWSQVRDVLPLDAFARCWVQEVALFDAVQAALAGERQALMAALNQAWRTRREATFDAAVGLLGASLARLATARAALPDVHLRDRLRQFGSALGLAPPAAHPNAAAEAALADTLAHEHVETTARLLTLHQLDGTVQAEVLARLDHLVELHAKADPARAGVLGGALTGALAGLKADLATGGLTLGGGLLAGGLLGALGGVALARGFNRIRGLDQSWLGWSGPALDSFVDAAMLRYLAVAHFGRGRGDWSAGEAPPHWAEVVRSALAPQRAAWAALWRRSAAPAADAAALATHAAQLEEELTPLLRAALTAALHHLYPGSLAPAQLPSARAAPPGTTPV